MKTLSLTRADLIEIDRELARRSFADFVRMAWHVIEPTAQLKWGWALDAICQHIEAVTDGEIRRLLINVPPGMMKSLLTSVFWPAWEWGPRAVQHHRFISTAHKQDLAIRDNLKCRRLIQSEWYQERWPVVLTGDQNAKTKFENDKTGFREAMAFTSMTGARGDRVILDDPLSADDASSAAAIDAAERAFLESLPTRVNNEKSAIVVIMQRLHQRDTSGIILERDLGYEHLCLPMRFEADRRCTTSIGFSDPRSADGELVFPERFPEKFVSDLERTLGSYASSGQLQQRPVPRGGGMFKREWFGLVDALPAGCRFVRGWDLAATESPDASATAGCLMARSPDGRFIICDVVTGRLSPRGVERLMRSTADMDAAQYQGVRGSFPQDPGQAGKSLAQHLVRSVLCGHDYTFSPESGSKVSRAGPLAAQAEAGNLFLMRGKWNAAFIEEATLFPNGASNDQIDAASRAFIELSNPVRYTFGLGGL